jgi:hypothetical protein
VKPAALAASNSRLATTRLALSATIAGSCARIRLAARTVGELDGRPGTFGETGNRYGEVCFVPVSDRPWVPAHPRPAGSRAYWASACAADSDAGHHRLEG